jgi:hypothetical protein
VIVNISRYTRTSKLLAANPKGVERYHCFIEGILEIQFLVGLIVGILLTEKVDWLRKRRFKAVVSRNLRSNSHNFNLLTEVIPSFKVL